MESPTTWPTAENGGDEMEREEEEEEEEEEGDEAITKRLVFDCAETPYKPELRRKVAAASRKQSVLTYLRIRPKSQREILSLDASCLHLLNTRELQAVAPASSQTFKNKTGARCPGESTQQFCFTHIFDETASQRGVFEEALVPTLRDFFDGQNCLVFTYGVTNSGKTYTVTGTLTAPGILPRSLDLIFNSVSPQQMSSLELRPKNFSEAIYLTEEEAASELTRRENILNKARTGEGMNGVEEAGDTDTSSNLSTLSKASSNYSKVSEPGASLCEIQVQDGSTIDLEDSGDVCYSLWVSFAEIYNEFIYDLLAEEPSSTRRRRPALRLAEDKNHNHFIKGLVEVKVGSVEEALLLLRMGVRHRHVAATNLNYQSSRSHTVFTVKMIKVLAGSDKPHSALVNRISIVDLAGAERSKETGAKGIRVREAGNINNSLLTLGKCIEAMRHNQNRRRGEEHIVPFRESKLTRLFQNYFIGKGKGIRQGKVTMLVNVSDNASVFDETIHVLKFSAITSKIVPIVKETVPVSQSRPPPLSRVLRSTVRQATTAAATPAVGKSGRAPVVNEDDEKTVEAKRTVSIVVCEQCEAKKKGISRLRRKLGDLEVEKMESEYQIRQEVCREFHEQLTEIEETHRDELEEQAEEMQEMYDKRMVLLQKSMKKEFNRKRRRVEADEEGEGEGSGRERREVDRLRDTVSRLEEELQSERAHNVTLSAEMKDVTETHENRVTRLNQQINSVSLGAAEAEGRARQLQEELAHVKSEAAGKENKLQENLANTERKAEEREREFLAVQEKLENEIRSVRTDLEERESVLVATRAKFELELTALQTQLAGTKGETVDTGSQLKESQDKFRDLQTQLARAEEEASDREEKLQEKVGELDRAEKELTAVVERENELRETCGTLQLQVEESGAQLAEKEAENEALRSDRLALISEYESRERQLREEIAELRSELGQAAVSGRLEREWEERVRQAEAGREDAVTEVEILQTRISELTREAEQETVLALEVQERVTELELVQAASQASSEAAQGEISSLQEQVEGQLAASKASSEVAQGEISGLQEQVEGLESQLSASKASSEAAQGEICSLQEQVEGLTSQLSASQANSEATQGEISGLQEQVEGLTSQLSASQASSEAAQGEISGLQEQVEGLESQLVEKERVLAALQAAKAVQTSETQAMVGSLLEQVMSVKVELSNSCMELAERCGAHNQLVRRLAAGVVGEREVLQNEVKELRGQLAAQETELKARETTAGIEVQLREQRKDLASEKETTSSEGEEMQSTEEDSGTDIHPTTTIEKVPSPSPVPEGLPRSDSKPHVAVLERSSLLMEDTFTDTTTRVVIDATPPIARKHGRKHKLPAKENIEEDLPSKKYPRRTRNKPKRFAERDGENLIPSLKALIPRIRPSRDKKVLSSAQPSPPPPSSPPAHQLRAAARSTRTTRLPIRKSQISGPLGLAGTGSPALLLSRCCVDIGPKAPPLYHDHHYT